MGLPAGFHWDLFPSSLRKLPKSPAWSGHRPIWPKRLMPVWACLFSDTCSCRWRDFSFPPYIIAGMPLLEILLSLGISFILFLGLAIMAPYRMARLVVLLHPEDYAQGMGYQTMQSLIAVGSGGILGQGMGEGFSKFLYLPEQYTDFAYAVFSQEYGFIGSATLLCLYLAFLLYGLSVGRKLKETYPALLVYGLTLLISVQGLVNIAMVIGWFPVTGIPLPFISFGGTSLLMNMAALGLIWGTATQSLREYDEQERRKRIAAMEGRPLSFGELSGSVYGSRS